MDLIPCWQYRYYAIPDPLMQLLNHKVILHNILNAEVFELVSKLCYSISDSAFKNICIFYYINNYPLKAEWSFVPQQEMYYFELDKVVPYCRLFVKQKDRMLTPFPMRTILGKCSARARKGLWLTLDRLPRMTGIYASQRRHEQWRLD